MSAEPSTPEEWQDAVDSAHFLLLVDAAVQYGLVKYTGIINVGRCEELLARGRELKVYPKKAEP